MHLPLISVIVPVYKVEAYLDKCISSIVNQTYTNLEIILVDDGSPDNCPAICDAWAAKDNRIKVIHKENGGLSDARNAGMKIVTGELLGFVDSDDWVEPDMYQLLYENLVANDCDISACGVQMDWKDGTPSRALTMNGSCILSAEEAMRAIIEESWLKQPVWYKLYKAKLVKDIQFPVGKYHEDVFWSYQAFGRANKVSVFDTPCYFYTQRAGSIMSESYSLRRLDGLEAKLARQEYIQQHFPRLKNLALRNLWGSCIYATQMLMRHCSEEEKQKGLDIMHTILKKYPIRLAALDIAQPKQCLWQVMAKISLTATCCIRNKFGIGF